MSLLGELYGTKPLGAWLLIWTVHVKTGEKQSHWYQSTVKANATARTLSPECDVYFGLGLSPVNAGQLRRATEDQIVGIPGLWIDVDYLDPVHKKSNLPPNAEEALKLIKSMPLEYSIVINSGHGFQAYWRFPAIWWLKSDDERMAAKGLSYHWQESFRRLAEEKGWAVDSTHDLTRILRVPGTYNHKRQPSVQVSTFTKQPERFHSPVAMMRALGLDPDSKSWYQAEIIGRKLASAGRISPGDLSFPKLKALVTSSPKVQATWRRQRPDFVKDDSPSAYDMAMAGFAVRAGWADEEIVALLMEFRRRDGQDLKLRNNQYYARTIAKARESASLVSGPKLSLPPAKQEPSIDEPPTPPQSVKKPEPPSPLKPPRRKLRRRRKPKPIEPETAPVEDPHAKIRESIAQLLYCTSIRVYHCYYPAGFQESEPHFEIHLIGRKKDIILKGGQSIMTKAESFNTHFVQQTGRAPIYFITAKESMEGAEGIKWSAFSNCLFTILEKRPITRVPKIMLIIASILEAEGNTVFDIEENNSQKSRLISERSAVIDNKLIVPISMIRKQAAEGWGVSYDQRELVDGLNRMYQGSVTRYKVQDPEKKQPRLILAVALPDDFMKRYYALLSRSTAEGETLDMPGMDDFTEEGLTSSQAVS